jgi:hypothetical protein
VRASPRAGPDRVADDVALVWLDLEPPSALDEQVRLALRAEDVSALNNDCFGTNAERRERLVDLRTPTRRGDAIDNTTLAKLREQLDRARKRSALRQQLAEQLAVPLLHRLDLGVVERTAGLASDRAGEQAAAHADPPVDPPAVDGDARLGERLLPGEHVGVDGVDERSVEIEDHRCHSIVRWPRALAARPSRR